MSFETFAIIGVLVLASGAVASVAFYVWRIARPRPSVLRYFLLATVAAFVSYMIGSFLGIGVMCASATAGNLCGIWGALGSGPLVAGLALWLFGPVYGRSMSR